MHPPAIDKRRPSWLDRVPPRLRLVAAFVLIVGTSLLPRQPNALYLAPAAFLLCLWPLSRMPVGYALRRMLAAEFFILSIGVLWLLRPSAAPALLSAILKSNLCVFAMLLLTWTTPFHEILSELRRLRFPSVMLTTLALMYRYLPVLAEESRRMQRARSSRTFTRRRWPQWQGVSAIIAQLFVRSAERAERIYLAMCARGWK